jgi:hypothetical protein
MSSAILNGVALLDEKGIKGWRDIVRTNATIDEPFDNLAMEFGCPTDSDTRCCMLALIYGTFSSGCEALGIRLTDAFAYGFEIDYGDPREGSVKYRELNEAWKAWFGCA